MTEITSTELARQLSGFVNRVTWCGEEFVITRGGKPVAALCPVPSGVRRCDLGKILDSLPPLPAGDLDDFGKDMKNIRREHNQKLVDPWQSRGNRSCSRTEINDVRKIVRWFKVG